MSMKQTVKNNAKNAMRTKYGRSIVMIMLLMGINILFYLMDAIITQAMRMPVFDNVEAGITPSLIQNINLSTPLIVGNIVIVISYFLVMAPLYYGASGWFYRVIGGQNCEIASAFNFFESAKLMLKSWGTGLNLLIRKIFYLALFSLPGAAIAAVGEYYKVLSLGDSDHRRYVLAISIKGLGLCLLVVAFICAFIYFKKYSVVKYLLNEDKNIKIGQAIRLSSKITKEQKAKIAAFDFSFIGWFILCVLIIPVLYVSPYYMTSKALYSKVLIERYYMEHPFSNDEIKSEDETKEQSDDISL